jgi:hypothetical protein
MKSGRVTLAIGLVAAALSGSAFGQQDEKLGKLDFPTSCDPKVQAEFERGVAMIHSYWFTIARRTFEGVLRQDPTCAMAHWGVAIDILGNILVGPPTRENANVAWLELEKARAIGAKTERERDWIEALSAYYRDSDKTPVNTRLAADHAALSGRLRSAGILRAHLAGRGVARGHDVCRPAQVSGNSGKAVRSEPAASGRDPLHHSCL